MIYRFDGIDISTCSVLPARGDGGYAVSGIFDFPKRKGEIERNWGDTVEPYLNEADMEFGERVIGLKLVMTDEANWDAFRDAAVACRKLGTELGDFDVLLADEVSVERLGQKMLKIDMKFRQNRVEFETLTLTASGGTGIRVDDFHLARDFGISVTGVKSDRNIPKRIEVNTTSPYGITRYREKPSFTLECMMNAPDLKEAGARMRQFHALWRQPGTRVLHLADGTSRNVFVKDGFSVSIEGDGLLKFSLKLEEYDRNI